MITSLAQAFDAVADDEIDAVKDYVLSHPEIVNAKTFFAGGTLLHYAAAKSSPEMIRTLVTMGFDVNKPGDTYGEMPLHSSCTNDMYENAGVLLSLGAELDVSESHRNPLFGAIIGSSPRIVDLLLKAGIDPDIEYQLEDGSVVNALGFARKRGDAECEKVLLAAYASKVH
jgi:uncharacterized protein